MVPFSSSHPDGKVAVSVRDSSAWLEWSDQGSLLPQHQWPCAWVPAGRTCRSGGWCLVHLIPEGAGGPRVAPGVRNPQSLGGALCTQSLKHMFDLTVGGASGRAFLLWKMVGAPFVSASSEVSELEWVGYWLVLANHLASANVTVQANGSLKIVPTLCLSWIGDGTPSEDYEGVAGAYSRGLGDCYEALQRPHLCLVLFPVHTGIASS